MDKINYKKTPEDISYKTQSSGKLENSCLKRIFDQDIFLIKIIFY